MIRAWTVREVIPDWERTGGKKEKPSDIKSEGF
jgi:hypothetical protein